MKFFTTNFLQPFGRDFFNGDFVAPEREGRHASNLLKTDIKEKEDGYVFDIELAGFKKDEVELSLEDGYMTVTAERKQESSNTDKDGYILQERRMNSASRTYYVGEVDEGQIKADMSDGVLTVVVPKEKPQPKETKKRIAIGG